MLDPNKIDKYLYINKTPTWKVRFLFSFGILSWLLVLWGYSSAILYDPFFRWIIAPMLFILTIYHVASFSLNLFYKKLDIEKHLSLTRDYWGHINNEPSVDIFLPICGEDISILDNTWKHVSQLRYSNKRVIVLDDSKNECYQHKVLARQYGFDYLERPNKGEMKKAGNLKYGYERSWGEFIVILDGDFAPHPDFLKETLPYTRNEHVGIVQTPQYFDLNKEIHKKSLIAYGAAWAQEIFYRVIQVARDRLEGSHCCGTCAVYRRQALKTIGGFVQMGHSEDAHTGFAMVSNGWRIKYLPIILSIGMSPDNVYSFFHQQHRWCLGNVVMILDKKFWTASVPLKTKFCYFAGFLYNIHYPLTIFFSFQLFWTLFFYNDYISFGAALIFYPHLAFTIFNVAFFSISRLRFGCLYNYFMKAYSNSHAIFSILTKRTVAWVATGSKHTKVSLAFKQTMVAVGAYVVLYGFLLLFAAFIGYLHPLSLNYYSVQFWLFYNMILSTFLFWQMFKFYRSTKLTPSSPSVTSRG